MLGEQRPLDLLSWQIESGADEAIGDEPKNRFVETAPDTALPQPPPARAVAAASPPTVATPRALAIPAARSAQEIAAACATVDELVAAINAFDGCALKETATNTVVYDGSTEARLMFVGEAPGAEEDRRGLPFVGAAGRLLDRMLAAIDLDRTSCCISNMLFWRPPGNRTPTADEIATCLPLAQRLIELVAPEVLVLVGGISAKSLLGRSEGITRLRGIWRRYETAGLGAPIDAIATYHPAYLLRQPIKKREAWRDLLAIKARLSGEG
jgi:DNA polymerase